MQLIFKSHQKHSFYVLNCILISFGCLLLRQAIAKLLTDMKYRKSVCLLITGLVYLWIYIPKVIINISNPFGNSHGHHSNNRSVPFHWAQFQTLMSKMCWSKWTQFRWNVMNVSESLHAQNQHRRCYANAVNCCVFTWNVYFLYIYIFLTLNHIGPSPLARTLLVLCACWTACKIVLLPIHLFIPGVEKEREWNLASTETISKNHAFHKEFQYFGWKRNSVYLKRNTTRIAIESIQLCRKFLTLLQLPTAENVHENMFIG